jgi:hypothetical protein
VFQIRITGSSQRATREIADQLSRFAVLITGGEHGGQERRGINSGSEYSRHHTRQNESARCCLLAETTEAPVAPTPPGLFSLQSFVSIVLENLIFRRLYTRQREVTLASLVIVVIAKRNHFRAL